MRSKNPRGFTLVEVLVSLAALALLSFGVLSTGVLMHKLQEQRHIIEQTQTLTKELQEITKGKEDCSEVPEVITLGDLEYNLECTELDKHIQVKTNEIQIP